MLDLNRKSGQVVVITIFAFELNSSTSTYALHKRMFRESPS
jgi:hypothetical protein